MPTNVIVPTLDTERLHLRGFRPDDLEAYSAMLSDPQFIRHVASQAIPREDVWARILRHIGHWAVFGFGVWALEEKATGRFAGEVGFSRLERDIAPPFGEAPEAGWGLAPWSHGQGFAKEATAAIHRWFDGEFGPRRTVCMIRPANTVSMRIAEKCGYRELHRVPYRGAPMVVFERTPPP
ncbi:GNAT family N-acetyltransferase [Pendulispora brunnea]|uniref:GNAT family N-acetyltransferase n=1 Tax=Pendulispora brunnea TaxID=2905690 RepID=A0ABZ2K2C8_9BACT